MKFEITDSGISAGDFLKTRRFSRRLISHLKFCDGILVNGVPVWTNTILSAGDILEVIWDDRLSDNIIPQDIPLSIIYEDDHLLAVNKPAGMAIHPSKGHGTGTLANSIAGYYEKSGINSAVRIAGRLDLDTTGVVLVSKDSLTAKILSETNIDKYYKAIVCGKLSETGRIEAPIAEIPGEIRRIVSPDGKPSVTEYRCEKVLGDCSVAEVRLITGRTHQIRLHMSYIGHPLIGDSLYGNGEGMKRQALHAERLVFPHPISGEKTTITAPVPEDMISFIQNCK